MVGEFRGRCYNGLMEFVELTETEFAKTHFGCENFLQSVEMFRRYQNLGREAYLVGVKKSQKLLATGLILGRSWRGGKKIYRVPGGWLLDYDEVNTRAEVLEFLTKQAREFCRKKGGIALEISPNIVSQTRDSDNQIVPGAEHLAVKAELEQLGYKYLGEYEQPKWLYVKDLAGETPEKMLREFRTTHRQLIQKAQREGVRVRELAENELGILKKIAAESGVRHGFKDPDLEYYRSMREAFSKKVKFVVAELPAANLKSADREKYASEGEFIPLAVSMYVQDGREMVYLYSGSRRDLQKYNGAYAIQWQMLNEALEAGLARYNFYGTEPLVSNGVYRFKQGFRGRVEELLGTFVLPIGRWGKLYALRLKPREYGEIS